MVVKIVKEDLFNEGFTSTVEKQDENQILDFVSLFMNVLQFGKEDTMLLISRMKEAVIENVDELSRLTDDQWKRLEEKSPTKIPLVREKIESMMNRGARVAKSADKSRYHYLADWHRLKRGLFFNAKMHEHLRSTGFLDKQALRGAIDIESTSDKFNAGPMLMKIREAFETFTIPENDNPEYSRGMLLYGPPGTGKTSIMNMIIRACGLTNLVAPLSSSEINRGLVGESEALLRDIFGRASYFPYLVCCICIDEIESMVPDRSKEQQSGSKGDNVNQLLALVGGATDIPNNYIMGATNHKSKMDEAFLRRLREKYFVGYQSGADRLLMVKALMKNPTLRPAFSTLDLEMENLIETITINFSGSATNDFRNKLKNYILIHRQAKINQELLMKFAEEVARANEILVGSVTIPSFLTSNDQDILNISQYVDKTFTGRMVIDMNESNRSIQFEVIGGRLEIVSLSDRSYSSIKDIVPILLQFTIDLKINYIKLIDAAYATKNSKSGESSASDAIMLFLNDFVNFTEGIVVIDGDTVVGTSISGTTETRYDPTKPNKSFNDASAWLKGVLPMFVTKTVISSNSVPRKWYIFATKEEFLLDSFKRDVNFPLTQKEQDIKDEEYNNKNVEKVCLNCGQKYLEDKNSVDSCTFHPQKLICMLDDSIEVSKDEFKELYRKIRDEDVPKEYKYFCCLNGFENEGCKKDFHSDTVLRTNNASRFEEPQPKASQKCKSASFD